MSQVHVVIPAYQPTGLLTQLVAGLVEARPSLDILLVDDGSDPATRGVFAACAAQGARVVRLPVNRGKGAALRAGFRFLLETRANGPVVTADADGQHAVRDILRVVDAVDDSPGAEAHLVIGERLLDDGVPWRSALGNAVTRTMFRAVTGRRVRDTQTGLRAFPSSLLPWLLEVRGDRYEYELHMLLRAAREGMDIRGEAIRTIYLDDNSSSHFRPVADSVRIYLPLLTFFASSLAGFAIDTVALVAFDALLDSLLLAVVSARVLSGVVNFALNRRFVFPGRRRAQHRGLAAARYALLATGLLVANYLILSTLLVAGLGLLASKVITEIFLVSVSYVMQARYVFVSESHTSDTMSTTG